MILETIEMRDPCFTFILRIWQWVAVSLFVFASLRVNG